MFSQTKIQQCIIRFRRWSRAKYAVFCSLASVVSIGCVAISIADKSLQKSVGVCAELSHRSEFDTSDETAETSEIEVALFQLREITLSEITFGSAAVCGRTSLYLVFI